MLDLAENVVAVAWSERPDYGPTEPTTALELPVGCVRTTAALAVRRLLRTLNLDSHQFGTPSWNPLASLCPSGSRVVIKPNWVHERNRSGNGSDCLVTHTSVVEAVLQYVAITEPHSIVVGDAPVQGCNFDSLRRDGGLDDLARQFQHRGVPLRIADFRSTTLDGEDFGSPRRQMSRATDSFILFDLGPRSLLEPISSRSHAFRVTMYNPDRMAKTHRPGRHQYLVAREVIEADVVINLPKLKCHKKACVTGALKNLVGINGNKEYLPHHRKGGADRGGDCYQGGSLLKLTAEELLDAANRAVSPRVQRAFARLATLALRLATSLGEDGNLEGSWFGNDTVWRTCLDLHRILRYGRPDGTLADQPQRTILSLTDAIIAGEGEGPLAPTPVPAGFLTAGLNPAAVEWVNTVLMGFDPSRIPLLAHAFDPDAALSNFHPDSIVVVTDQGTTTPRELAQQVVRPFRPAHGWIGHCETVRP
jgi:uncharacterized protein (DUF362 family)